VVRTAVTVWWIAKARLDNLCLQLCGAPNRGVEVIDFKPEEYAVSRRDTGISDEAVVMFYIPRMQLKNQTSIGHEPLVLRTAMVTATVKQTLIPTAACFHIADANQRLWIHTSFAWGHRARHCALSIPPLPSLSSSRWRRPLWSGPPEPDPSDVINKGRLTANLPETRVHLTSVIHRVSDDLEHRLCERRCSEPTAQALLILFEARHHDRSPKHRGVQGCDGRKQIVGVGAKRCLCSHQIATDFRDVSIYRS
jgi:hypothetical protein